MKNVYYTQQNHFVFGKIEKNHNYISGFLLPHREVLKGGAKSGLIRQIGRGHMYGVYTVSAIPSACTYYCMLKSHYSNFRISTADFWVSKLFQFLLYLGKDHRISIRSE